MRSPADMETIQIEITNACVHSCSNCTRLCGHHKSPFFMNWETFSRAVESLQGFSGIIGMMGGEPTLHPEFKRFALHLKAQHGKEVNLQAARRPLKDFMQYTRVKHNAYRVLNRDKGPGLWTSITKSYYDYFELIQDTFVFQCLNDHLNASYHQPIMITRRELGIPDREWHELRDRCWIQNSWSASITPKGAFFCEVAAALDMLFDGPGGWPVEPGWWKRQPEDFSDQLHWCEMCGVALETFKRNANEEIDDVSPVMYDRLLKVDSPKVKKGAVAVCQPGAAVSKDGYAGFVRGQYIADASQRIAKENTHLYLKAMEGILFCDSLPMDAIEKIIEQNGPQLERIFLLTASTEQAGILRQLTGKVPLVPLFLANAGWGNLLNLAIAGSRDGDWLLLLNESAALPADFREDLRSRVLNPGVLYQLAEVAFFNKRASALAQAGFDRIARCGGYAAFEQLWDQAKVIRLSDLAVDDYREELQWRLVVDENFSQDLEFRQQFELVMLQSLPGKGPVLITQSASYFLTRGLIRLLKEFGFEPHVMTHQRFAPFFADSLPAERVHVFAQPEHFAFVELQPFCDALLERVAFRGAVIPYSLIGTRPVLSDGYQQIEQVARYLGGKVIARVNLKRRFVMHDQAEVESPIINPWNY